jgi:hypothetical protein
MADRRCRPRKVEAPVEDRYQSTRGVYAAPYALSLLGERRRFELVSAR